MKKIMIALAIMGATFTGTQVQARQACDIKTKKVVHHHRKTVHKIKVASSAHQVCTEQNGYYTCCVYKNSSTRIR